MCLFQSTPPSRGATTFEAMIEGGDDISIHAPLAGGDQRRPLRAGLGLISIHAPLAGGDSHPNP